MHLSSTTRLPRTSRIALAVALCAAMTPVFADESLIEPLSMVVDASLPEAQLAEQVLAARRYDTFWSTGDEALARAALAPDFVDRTLPPGRPQGLAGPLAASRSVHAAIPDIRCEVEQMIVAGDRVVVHLRFTGHFTGEFGQARGHGQPIDFIATDIYRVANGRIAENWHLEDNLSLLQQLGLIAN
jgi:predicted ester cyclase